MDLLSWSQASKMTIEIYTTLLINEKQETIFIKIKEDIVNTHILNPEGRGGAWGSDALS